MLNVMIGGLTRISYQKGVSRAVDLVAVQSVEAAGKSLVRTAQVQENVVIAMVQEKLFANVAKELAITKLFKRRQPST